MPVMIPLLLAAAHAPPPTAPANSCAKSDIVTMAPGDMLQRLDDFRDSLSRAERRRLDRALPRSADGGIAACDRAEGSRASCEASAYMPALRATGLMPKFLGSICPERR